MPSGEHAKPFNTSFDNVGLGKAILVFCWFVTVRGSPKLAENKLDNKHIVAGILDAPLIARPAAHGALATPRAAAEELLGTVVFLFDVFGT